MNNKELREQEQDFNAERVTNEMGGMQSKTSFDFTLIPSIQGLFDVIKVMTENCDEYGGHYPRDNWKRISTSDNFNHAVQHVLEALDFYQVGDGAQSYEHISHAICRLMFIQWSINDE